MPRLNAPTILIFLLSLIMAIFAVVMQQFPAVISQYNFTFLPYQEFWLAIGAYVVLMIGNLVRGL